MFDLIEHFLRTHPMPAGEGVLAVAPAATQVASRQAHEHTRQPGMGGFALDRFVNLGYLHGESWFDRFNRAAADWSLAAAYSEYFAVVVSVSNTVTSFTETRPCVTVLSRPLVSS